MKFAFSVTLHCPWCSAWPRGPRCRPDPPRPAPTRLSSPLTPSPLSHHYIILCKSDLSPAHENSFKEFPTRASGRRGEATGTAQRGPPSGSARAGRHGGRPTWSTSCPPTFLLEFCVIKSEKKGIVMFLKQILRLDLFFLIQDPAIKVPWNPEGTDGVAEGPSVCPSREEDKVAGVTSRAGVVCPRVKGREEEHLREDDVLPPALCE